MTASRALHVGDPRVSPALSSHLERHLAGHRSTDSRSRLTARQGVDRSALATALGGVRLLSGVVLDWPTRSHRRALRNAMLASTVLVERRIERDDVESFLQHHDESREAADRS